MHRPVYSSLQRSIRPRQRSFSTRPHLALWGGTTHPYENQKISYPPSSTPHLQLPTPPADLEKIESIHRKFVEDLLNRAAASVSGLDASIDTRLKTAPPPKKGSNSKHSLSEPPLFRTDGPLTPYPIELDSGELLEPKHATLVRILDRQGEERTIVVAEVEEESGKRRRVLLAVDLNEYQDSGTAVGRKVSAEEMYATVGLDPPRVQS